MKTIPSEITQDRLWTVTAYRLSLFLSTIGWHDVTKLASDERTLKLSGQLYRALGSIHANYAEGYSHSTGPNRARYFEYALGSARESREWYFDARHVLGAPVFNHRLALLARIIQLLIKTIPEQRHASLREVISPYMVDEEAERGSIDTVEINQLLLHVPLCNS